jgi:hypothetical protein
MDETLSAVADSATTLVGGAGAVNITQKIVSVVHLKSTTLSYFQVHGMSRRKAG